MPPWTAEGGDVVRTFVILAAVLGFVGVALGAFGAHGLRGRVSPEDLEIFETGVRYQMYHVLALLAVGWLSGRYPGTALVVAGWLMTAGIVVFSGSLYVLVLSGVRWLGAVTPLGGLCLLAGWMAMAWGVIRG